MKACLRRENFWAFSLLTLICATTQPVVARDWKPTPQAKANDYLQIKHAKSPSEFVFVFWSAPESLGPIPEESRNVLREHLIIAVIHMKTSETGEITMRPRGEVMVKDTVGAMRAPLVIDTLPYNVTFTLNILRQMSSQLGVLGKGLHFYVFEPKGTHSCRDGQFWVVYEGEEYEYKTPIPGCQ